MAGHSKYANIKHRKAAQDKKRAKVFTKAQREIYIAAKSGLPDPDLNHKLKLAIIKARSVNVSKELIEKAIKKASGEGSGNAFNDIRYNLSAGEVSIIVECSTDNTNRSVSDIKAAIGKTKVHLVETGSIEFMFKHIGLVEYSKPMLNFEEFFEKSLEVDPLDVYEFEGDFFVETEYKDFHKIEQTCTNILNQEPSSASLIWKPNDTVEVDEEKKNQLINFIDKLEELEDVVDVYSNISID